MVPRLLWNQKYENASFQKGCLTEVAILGLAAFRTHFPQATLKSQLYMPSFLLMSGESSIVIESLLANIHGRKGPRAVLPLKYLKRCWLSRVALRSLWLRWAFIHSLSLSQSCYFIPEVQGCRGSVMQLFWKNRNKDHSCRYFMGEGQNYSKTCQDKQRQEKSQENFEKRSTKVKWRKKERGEEGTRNKSIKWNI